MNAKSKQTLLAIILILLGVVLRLLELIPNFSPVTAIALLGGAYLLDKRWSIIIPVASLFISDILLGYKNNYPFFHNTIFFVYISYIIIAFLGWKLRSEKVNYLQVGGFAMVSSLLFFIISNFGVWIVGTLYERNLAGLVNCFDMAIPFYKYTFLGDVVYTLLFFVVFNVIKNLTIIKLTPSTIK
ncbi:MAG: hypothetical protein IPF58_06020 [Saprospirales bacterium]|nr:hypothetical protein [Saprospirales bacterium]